MRALPQDSSKQVSGPSFVNMRDSTGFDESREFAAMSIFREAAVFAIAFMGLNAVACELSTADDDAMHAGPVMNYHKINQAALVKSTDNPGKRAICGFAHQVPAAGSGP